MIQKLQETSSSLSSEKLTEPIVLCAADENYVRPLAVTLSSAAQSLADGCRLKVIVLDGGISEHSWSGLKETLANLPVEIYTIRPGLNDVSDLGTSHHITHTAYLRLFAGRLLPDSIDRVIYLDSDLLVCDDLSELWHVPVDDQFALAVPDIACPYVDIRFANCNFKKASAYCSAISPVRNWRQLGLDPSSHYFNSGVMVLNIKRMREEKIERRLLDCLHENEEFVWCWDQYALNVVFAGQWKPLSLRWNQGAHFFEYPDERFSPFNATDFLDARDNPSIIHFTTEWKPWHFGNKHPMREHYFEQLDQTAWRGWRPIAPPFSFKKNWQTFATAFVKRSGTIYRKVASQFHRRKNIPASQLPELLRKNIVASTGLPDLGSKQQANSLLTIFSIPKPFEGAMGIVQRNAINSWKQLEPFAEIVLLGNDTGTSEIAAELDVRHIPEIERNDLQTPLVSSALSSVREYSSSPFLAWCNCDVILFKDFEVAIRRLIEHPDTTSFLAIGQRTDLVVNQEVDFRSAAAVSSLKEQARSNGILDSIVCKDYMVFPRELYSGIPDFAVGRGNWDNWMVRHAKESGASVVSVTDCVLALHQKHDYGHCDDGRLGCYVTGVEARENQNLAEGRHLLLGSTCDLRLDADTLRPSRMKFAHGEFWKDFPSFVRLLLNFVGLR